MAGLGVPADYTEHAIAITDKTRLDYARITKDWPRSNPEGFARWFEDRMRQGPMNRAMVLVREGVYASIDDVPAHERKTVLQRVVQILKRHRDVMFRDDCELKPISVIISTLSAEAYAGQASLYEGLSDVIAAMPGLVRRGRPRIPSPVNPAEDFADKWVAKPELERNFWAWHTQLQRDLQRLADATGSETRRSLVETAFALSISPDELRAMGGAAAEGEASMPPYVHVASGPSLGRNVPDNFRRLYLAWGVDPLLRAYRGLCLRPHARDGLLIAGDVAFTAGGGDLESLTDTYSIRIDIPCDFPRRLPRVHECGGRIPRNYHKLDDGALCLGSNVRLRMKLGARPTLLNL